MEVIPAVNAQTFEAVTRDITRVAPYTSWIHLDVSDGTLTNGVTTWCRPLPLQNFQRNIEVHCMVMHPERIARIWAEAGAARILVHAETVKGTKNIYEFLNCAGYGGEIGLVCTKDTPLSLLTQFLHPEDATITPIQYVQFLAVLPGRSGQVFDSAILKQIVSLRQREPEIIIAVDGGINPSVAYEVKRAGANVVVSHKYIFEHHNLSVAFQELHI